MKKGLLALTLLALGSTAWGQEQVLSPTEAPPPPKPVQSGEPLEPEINIVKSDKGTIEQYQINGHTYMVKVIPVAGEPYYLFDTDGDGELDSQADDMRNISVPKWILFSW